jgi:hypothetical protein
MCVRRHDIFTSTVGRFLQYKRVAYKHGECKDPCAAKSKRRPDELRRPIEPIFERRGYIITFVVLSKFEVYDRSLVAQLARMYVTTVYRINCIFFRPYTYGGHGTLHDYLNPTFTLPETHHRIGMSRPPNAVGESSPACQRTPSRSVTGPSAKRDVTPVSNRHHL